MPAVKTSQGDVMTKKITVPLAKIKETKGQSRLGYLHRQTDEQIQSNASGARESRELSDLELRELRKPKKS